MSLEELATIEGPALVSVAVRFGGTRLIDNVTVVPKAAGASPTPTR
jgi:pantothenate synthetase